MAIISKIFIEKERKINLRVGNSVADVTWDSDIFQMRTFANGDYNREKGSKQNIQLRKKEAIELRSLLDKFIIE